jgi:hypothetical protein
VGGHFQRQTFHDIPLAVYGKTGWEYPILRDGFGVNDAVMGPGGVLYVGTSTTVFSVKDTVMYETGGTGYESQIHGDVTVVQCDGRGKLYAAGADIHIGSTTSPVSIVCWDGSRWCKLSSPQKPAAASASARPARPKLPKNLPLPDTLSAYDIKSFAVTPDSHVYISGMFEIPAGKEFLNHLAHWDGKAWRAVGPGLSGSATALAADRFGNLYAAGPFSTTGGRNEWRSLLHWDGISWKAIDRAPDRITALACDASGYLYIGTAGTDEAGWPQTLCRWDDSTMREVPGAPRGTMFQHSFNGVLGHIAQLDVIGSSLHVQGDFSIADGEVSPGYAVYDLGAPDTARINAKLAAMRRAQATPGPQLATVRLEESYCTLSENQAVRFEKMEITNHTAMVQDSAILFATDSAGFIYKAEEYWSHPTLHPTITSGNGGYRFAFPIYNSLRPGQCRPLWIRKVLRGAVTPAETDAWTYKDSLRPLFSNVTLAAGPNDSVVFRLSISEDDSFTVIRGPSFRDDGYSVIKGTPGKAFEVQFARRIIYDSIGGAVMSYVDCQKLIGAYTPPPRALLPGLGKLSHVKKALLARELLDWCLSFGEPVTEGTLWDYMGDGDDTVPKAAELKRRFGEISRFYLDVLAVVSPAVENETLTMVSEKIAEWHFPQCASESDHGPKIGAGDILKCWGNPGFYPMDLIRKSLKILGPAGKRDLERFEKNFSDEE